MSMGHGFGAELGSDPTTYTCYCGFRSTSYGDVANHIAEERERSHAPRRLTTIPAIDSQPTAGGIEVASTPCGDKQYAVEIRLTIHEGGGHYRRHMLLLPRDRIPFLIGELEAHRLDKDADPCTACAAQALSARVMDEALGTKHTCPEPLKPGSP